MTITTLEKIKMLGRLHKDIEEMRELFDNDPNAVFDSYLYERMLEDSRTLKERYQTVYLGEKKP